MNEKIGLYIGRFQPFHNGHASVVDEALIHCQKLVIAVGSSQESRTKKNPFTFEERKKFILRGLFFHQADNVIIVPVPDREEYSDDSNWGQYVLDCVEKECGLRPTINFEGEEECRSTWFDGIDIERVVIDRKIIPFSATAVREALLKDNGLDFFHMMAQAQWLYYEQMRRIILEVENAQI